MINKLPKQIKKQVYHILTSGNADIAFYTEAFVTSNKEWIMKKPILFGLHLIKINLECRIPARNHTIKGLVPGKKCIARIHRRPKVYQYAMNCMKYQYIMTDLFGSLMELTLDWSDLYQKIEKEYRLSGFQTLRRQKENNFKNISVIYDEISDKLGVKLNKEIELNMIKRHLVINPYMKKVLEIAAYNGCHLVAILETSYSVDDIKGMLGDTADLFSEIQVSNETALSFSKMRNKFMERSQQQDRTTSEKTFAMVSANYNKAIKPARRHHIEPIYYRSAKEIMKSIPIPNLTKTFKMVYQTITGMQLFSGEYSHKNIYETTYLYLAPAIYALLDYTHQRAVQGGGKVILLCDPQCIFSVLYKRYFGEADNCIWSAMAGTNPDSMEEWENLLEDCYFLGAYPADRFSHALGFSFPKQLLKNSKTMFCETAWAKARSKSQEGVTHYLKSILNHHPYTEKKYIVVDPMPGLLALDSFCEYILEVDGQIQPEKISMSRFLNRSGKELSLLHRVLQMDLPYVMGIYGEQTHLDEITFSHLNFIDETKKKIIYAALTDYCKAFSEYREKQNQLVFCPSDINALLNFSQEGFIQLEDEMGGGWE